MAVTTSIRLFGVHPFDGADAAEQKVRLRALRL